MAGGIAYVLDAMGEQLQQLVNVTLLYPQGIPTLWSLMCGKVRQVTMHVDILPIPREFVGRDYSNDEAYRNAFQAWINELWQQKDLQLDKLCTQYQQRQPA